jgi:hypothetical protein
VKPPVLLDVGATNEKAAAPNDFVIAENPDRAVVAGLTVRVAVVVADEKLSVLAWLTVMVEVPPPTMVTVVPEIVATAVFELVYVINPALLVVGATNEKAAFPNVFVSAENPDKTVVI